MFFRPPGTPWPLAQSVTYKACASGRAAALGPLAPWPVVLRGLGADWPALRRWGQREYLEAVCGGERSVLCEVNRQGRLFSYGSSDDSVHLPLRSVLDALSAAADEEPGAQQLYVAQTPVDDLGPRLREGKCSRPPCVFFQSLT